MSKKLSIWLLEQAEYLFLIAHGFEKTAMQGRSYWVPPLDYPFRRLSYMTRGHAINALKQAIYNPMHGGKRSKAV